ncbi:OTU-domain-containing protein [Gloeophyllum trabeum ATCC 11539]|uniref:OTU-domain-containing protein n=1 Tax=Gloeophyllum trabeum (strain ATCC 11539 / FP-39264 / Madison 617) TaxID=670483 RepID=S7RXR6_GLOTA|nr:OTU-domain-containing protein [Gloeophyllum trabeum ATCC 11539]EPQ58164.1 OTU-domain-containing protein [Gloeophyllum trabeum ATCC 11539]
MDELMAQLDSKDETIQKESANVLNDINVNQAAQSPPPAQQKKDPKSRYQARQARKAAALVEQYSGDNAENDARIEQETKEEEASIKKVCDELNLEMHEAHGHCLFSAVADQLSILGILPSSQASYATTRAAAADYIAAHPDDFVPFLPSAGGEDAPGAGDAGFMTPAQFQRYCHDIRSTGAWGGEPEILALARVYNVPIHVVQSGTPPIVVHDPAGTPGDPFDKHVKAVRISYHRRMYGLGEHYNSLRPKSSISSKLSDAVDNILNR